MNLRLRVLKAPRQDRRTVGVSGDPVRIKLQRLSVALQGLIEAVQVLGRSEIREDPRVARTSLIARSIA